MPEPTEEDLASVPSAAEIAKARTTLSNRLQCVQITASIMNTHPDWTAESFNIILRDMWRFFNDKS